MLQEYLPAGRQVGKRIRSNSASLPIPGRAVEINKSDGIEAWMTPHEIA
jgi:hypothetical protein